MPRTAIPVIAGLFAGAAADRADRERAATAS
jgi:hypothetical protein